MGGLLLVAVVTVLYSLAASRLDRLSVGAPIVFVGAGVLLAPWLFGDSGATFDTEPVRLLAEATLALLLFADASGLGLGAVSRDAGLSGRLLGIGLPLTMLLGTAIAYVLLPGTPWILAGLVAVILAPTDAALSQPVLGSPLVPVRIRRTLNVESGLNDGIATPVVSALIALAVADEMQKVDGPVVAAEAILVAVVVAVVVGGGGGRLIRRAHERGWSTPLSENLAVIVLAGASYVGAVQFGGNGFVAAFVAGLIFGRATRREMRAAIDYTETTALFLSFAVWLVFGATLARVLVTSPWNWSAIGYAALSLTVIRMVPVALALLGSGMRTTTVLFIGWFGPRGMASVVFLIVANDDLHVIGLTTPVIQAVGWTILLSVVLHGLTAGPLAQAYGARIAAVSPPPVEAKEADEPHPRRRSLLGD